MVDEVVPLAVASPRGRESGSTTLGLPNCPGIGRSLGERLGLGGEGTEQGRRGMEAGRRLACWGPRLLVWGLMMDWRPGVGETNCVAIRLVSSLPFLSVCSRRRRNLQKGKRAGKVFSRAGLSSLFA